MRPLLILALFVVGCAEPRPEPTAPTSEPEPGGAPSHSSPPPNGMNVVGGNDSTAPANKSAPATVSHRDAGTPALSSPNARAPGASADAGAASETEQPRSNDPHTKAVERVAIIARGCYEKNVGNVDGRFALELTMGEEGKIVKTIVRGVEGTPVTPGFEKCLVEGLQKEKFTALAAYESLVEVPLQFKKH